MMTKKAGGKPAICLALYLYNVMIIHEDPSPLMAKHGLSGRGTRPMTDHWNQDNGYRHRKLDQTMTVSIDRLLLKLCLDRGKDETSLKAFEEGCTGVCFFVFAS